MTPATPPPRTAAARPVGVHQPRRPKTTGAPVKCAGYVCTTTRPLRETATPPEKPEHTHIN